MTTRRCEFAVIGAGVVGSAIARTIAGSRYRVALLDSRAEVCGGTSKANTAILHTGYDAQPGTLEAKLVARGYKLTYEYCKKTGISVEKTGAILVAWDEEQKKSLTGLQHKAELNGYTRTRIMTPDEVYTALPALGPGATGGLEVPDESIIDPWSVPLAYATDAVNRGCELILNCTVKGIDIDEKVTILHTSTGDIETEWVINAAGLGGDDIDRAFGFDRLVVTPRRGELLVYDKLTAPMAPKIVLAAPSKVGKGVLISPTIFGNTMLGPTADDIEDKTDTGTSESGFNFLTHKGSKIMPALLTQEVTAAYAGLRAAHNQPDYLIEAEATKRYLIAGAIRSTGLTSAIAVAEYVGDMLSTLGFDMSERESLPPAPTMPPLGERFQRPFANEALIEKDPEYGEMMCFCERVTKGEIRDSLESVIPARSLEGIRRRTRAMNGRCQGFFCGAKVKAYFDEHSREESDT